MNNFFVVRLSFNRHLRSWRGDAVFEFFETVGDALQFAEDEWHPEADVVIVGEVAGKVVKVFESHVDSE